MKGEVFSINISWEKGKKKYPIKEAYLKKNYGVLGDCHAGKGEREVSLLPWEKMEEMKQIPCPRLKGAIVPGVFAENITTKGFPLHLLKLGDYLKIGEAVVKVIARGKKCHSFCEIARIIGKCIMPDEGVFAKVVKGGWVKVGDKIEKVKYDESEGTGD